MNGRTDILDNDLRVSMLTRLYLIVREISKQTLMSLARQRANICAAWTFSSSECVASQIRLWKVITCFIARTKTFNINEAVIISASFKGEKEKGEGERKRETGQQKEIIKVKN